MRTPASSQRDTRIGPQGSGAFDRVNGTPDERAEIESRIQRAVDDHRIRVEPQTFQVQPRRPGWVLPLAVNLAAVAIIAGGTLLSIRLLATQERRLAAGVAQITSAEGRVLSEFRQESEARLSSKEAEIAEIEAELAEAESELELLRLNAEEELRALESQLRAEVEAELAAEAARLADVSISETERSERLEAFRESRQAQLAQDLEELEARVRAELAGEEQALKALVAEYESSLAAATVEREALESMLRAREQALQEERDAVARRLEELRSSQERERLVLDQLLGHYSGIRRSLEQADHEEASRRIASLREYVETGPVAQAESLSERRAVELFLVGVLEQQVAAASSPEDSGGSGQAELTALVEELQQELEVERARNAELTTRLRGLTERFEAAAESLDAARSEIAALRTSMQRQQELAEGIQAYRRSVASRLRGGESGMPLELLEVKLQVLRLLASESVRADYPDLYEGLNEYLDALVSEQRADAARAALRELTMLLETLGVARDQTSPAAAEEPSRTYPVLSGPEAAAEVGRFLEALAGAVHAGSAER